MKIPDVVLLTREEEIALGRRVQAWRAGGDAADGIAARNELVERNLPLVAWVVANHMGGHRRNDESDEMQAGVIGLIHAALTFDPERGNRFSTYAAFRIRDHVMRLRRAGRHQDRMVHAAFAVESARAAGAPTGDARELLAACLEAGDLDERQSAILRLFYGLDGERAPDSGVATQFGISKQRAEQIRSQACRRILARLPLFGGLRRAVEDYFGKAI